MSIASQDDGKISIIYKVFGEGTKIISNWKKNEKVDIVGPLGNYWDNFDDKVNIIIADINNVDVPTELINKLSNSTIIITIGIIKIRVKIRSFFII